MRRLLWHFGPASALACVAPHTTSSTAVAPAPLLSPGPVAFEQVWDGQAAWGDYHRDDHVFAAAVLRTDEDLRRVMVDEGITPDPIPPPLEFGAGRAWLLSWHVSERDTCEATLRSLTSDGQVLTAVFDDSQEGDTCGALSFLGIQLFELPDGTPHMPVVVDYREGVR